MPNLKFAGLAALREMVAQNKNMFLANEDLPSYEIVQLQQAESGFITSYQLQKTVNGTSTMVGSKINFAADIFVQRVSGVLTAAEADASNNIEVGDKYVEFTVGTTEDENPTILKLKLTDLVDTYVAGDGVSISASNEVGIIIDPTNANGLSVGANGLALGLASASTAGALSAADYARFSNAADANLALGTETGNGNVITGLSVNASGELVADKGIIALQESDIEEISAAEVQALYAGGSAPTPTPTKHTVTFKTNPSEDAIDPQEVEDGGKVTKPRDPVMTNGSEVFKKWVADNTYGAISQGTEWDFENYTVTSDIVLRAEWGAQNDPNEP